MRERSLMLLAMRPSLCMLAPKLSGPRPARAISMLIRRGVSARSVFHMVIVHEDVLE